MVHVAADNSYELFINGDHRQPRAVVLLRTHSSLQQVLRPRSREGVSSVLTSCRDVLGEDVGSGSSWSSTDTFSFSSP